MIHTVGTDFKANEIHSKITDQLLTLTHALQDWQPLTRGDFMSDCQYHITFKIINGELVEIMG